MQGRKPTPTALKIVTGNPGQRALPAHEPRPEPLRSPPPEFLSDRARQAWNDLAPVLDRVGVLAETDAAALVGLCEAYADLQEARAALAEGKRFYTTTTPAGDTMIRPHPALAAASDADRRFRAWLVEFGMTPSARSRVAAAGSDDEQDPAARYFD